MSTGNHQESSETGSRSSEQSPESREEVNKASVPGRPSNTSPLDRPGELLADRLESLNRLAPPERQGSRVLGEQREVAVDISPSAHRVSVEQSGIGAVHPSSGATSLQAPSNIPKAAATFLSIPPEPAERPSGAHVTRPQNAAQTQASGMQPPGRPPAPTVAASPDEQRPRLTPSQEGLPFVPPPALSAVA